MSPSFILASQSPRRRDMLAALDLPFVCESPRIDELIRAGEAPAEYAARLAWEKARAVLDRRGGGVTVLAADTVVFIGDRLLDKPADDDDARRTLRALSGREHRVVTAVALLGPKTKLHRTVKTKVRFQSLSDAQIDWYVRTGEPADKAGAYGIQGKGAMLVEAIEGSHSNVIGLPLVETLDMLVAAGVTPPWSRGADEGV